jgi:acylphosphatase
VLIGERFTRAGLKAMFCHEQCDPDQSIAGKGSSASRQNEKSPVSGVMVAKRVLYEGRVQGVGFRFSVKSVTTGYDVVGSVKNLIDGRVEVEVQGEESEVEEFLKAILDSHLRRYINRFVVHDIALKRGVKGFAILP